MFESKTKDEYFGNELEVDEIQKRDGTEEVGAKMPEMKLLKQY